MFDSIAPYYDYYKLHRDYESEATEIHQALFENPSGRKSLLELGCGSGSLLMRLVKFDLDLSGLDASEGMLDVARAKLPKDVTLYNDSFSNFHSDNRYDGIIWIDGAIGYVPPGELDSTLENISDQLNTEGKLLIEPWYSKSNWLPNTNHLITHTTDEGNIFIRMSHGNDDGSVEFHHLFGTAEGIEHYVSNTKFWLHEYQSVCNLLGSLGMDVCTVSATKTFKRGLILASKQ